MNTEQTTTGDEGQETIEVAGNSVADISELLGIEEKTPEGEQGGGEKTTPAPAQQPKEKAPPAGGTEEQKLDANGNPAAPAPTPSDEKPKPQGENEDLKSILKEVLAEQKKPAEPEKKPEPEAPKAPKYSPQIPPQLMQALEHEDPGVRQQGMAALIGGAMNRIYEDLTKEFSEKLKLELAEVRKQVPQDIQAQQELERKREELRTDFYGSFPEFGTTPKLRMLVGQVAINLAQSMGQNYKGYNAEFKSLLEKELRELTGIQPKTPEKPTPGKKPGTPALKPTPGARSEPSAAQTLIDEIASVVL